MSGDITVNPAATISLTSSAATTNQTLCVNTPINNIVYTTANGSTGAAVTGLPAGVSGYLCRRYVYHQRNSYC